MSTKPKIIVFGIAFWYPLAGVTYQFLHYLLGLRRLGYDPYYIEDSARWVLKTDMSDLTPDADPNVKAILVNIFGGIVRCDLIAEGIINAIDKVHVSVPVVVRLEGTNVEQGRQMLADCDFDIISADGFDDAARKVVATVQGTSS